MIKKKSFSVNKTEARFLKTQIRACSLSLVAHDRAVFFIIQKKIFSIFRYSLSKEKMKRLFNSDSILTLIIRREEPKHIC